MEGEHGRSINLLRGSNEETTQCSFGGEMKRNSTSDETTTRRTLAAMSYLITPPEEVHHSFSSQDDVDNHSKQAQWEVKLPPLRAHTPPISPKSSKLPSIATATGFSSHDPTLFPDEQARRTTSPEPLFPNTNSPAKPTVSPKPTLPRVIGIPPNSLAKRFGIHSPVEALQYWHDRCAELQTLTNARGRSLPHPGNTSTQRDRFDQQQVRKLSRPAGITKSRAQPKVATKSKVAAAASPDKSPAAALPSRTRTRTPRIRNSIDSPFPSAQQPAKHKRAPPSKKVAGDNVSWRELPDYSPPTSTLDEPNAKPLTVVWQKGQAFDTESDPDRSQLHPQEIRISTELRLHAQHYLTCKRQIFQGKLQAIKEDKNFTKTKAQEHTQIDVNKASQLWTAFERVGWFDRKWFEQYL